MLSGRVELHPGCYVTDLCVCFQDALSSILVARDGYGDMAVSNAIGSNVFDINLGLGLPFIIRIAIDKGKPIDLLDDEERVSSLPPQKSNISYLAKREIRAHLR